VDELLIEGIGLGDDSSIVRLDDHELLSIDLNADSGRRADVSVRPAAGGGLPTFAFDPGLDLVVAFDLRPLAEAGDAVDSGTLHETYEIAFAGEHPAWQPIADDPIAGTGGALRIADGTLRLSTTAVPSAVVVPSGRCLLSDPVEAGEHPVLGGLTSGECP
jgi:hypothetical protein